jgi:hypothetical protein
MHKEMFRIYEIKKIIFQYNLNGLRLNKKLNLKISLIINKNNSHFKRRRK